MASFLNQLGLDKRIINLFHTIVRMPHDSILEDYSKRDDARMNLFHHNRIGILVNDNGIGVLQYYIQRRNTHLFKYSFISKLEHTQYDHVKYGQINKILKEYSSVYIIRRNNNRNAKHFYHSNDLYSEDEIMSLLSIRFNKLIETSKLQNETNNLLINRIKRQNYQGVASLASWLSNKDDIINQCFSNRLNYYYGLREASKQIKFSHHTDHLDVNKHLREISLAAFEKYKELWHEAAYGAVVNKLAG